MKIGFFGTPDIAAYCLDKLKDHFEIVFAVTKEDKPYGRNLKLRPCPAKEIAIANNIRVYHPASLKDPAFIDEIENLNADAFVIVAYGRIIPAEIYNIPRFKTINLHPSLLPKYRGAAPVEWAIINGEKESGITIQTINDKMDEGDIILQEKIPITWDMNSGELYNIVLPLGAEFLIRALRLLESGKAEFHRQNHAEAVYCKKIVRETAHISWQGSSLDIHNLVRGLNPKVGAWSSFRGSNLIIWKTSPYNENSLKDPEPGCLYVHKKKLFAGTGDGFLEIEKLQPETKKIMDGISFINGYRPGSGDRFE